MGYQGGVCLGSRVIQWSISCFRGSSRGNSSGNMSANLARCYVRVFVIDQEVARGGEFHQEQLIAMILCHDFQFSQGDNTHCDWGDNRLLWGFWVFQGFYGCLGKCQGGCRELL